MSALLGKLQLISDVPEGKSIEVSLPQGEHSTALLYEGFGQTTSATWVKLLDPRCCG
ncbi:MAG: hypothetical protein R2748_23650 [Bryobacterales bacterium]